MLTYVIYRSIIASKEKEGARSVVTGDWNNVLHLHGEIVTH